MSSQTQQPSCTPTASQDPSPSARNFVVSTIVSLVSSSGPFGDWLKLFVIGGVLELTRRVLMFVWRNLVNQFWITIALEGYTDSHSWMMVWLSKQPAWTRAKELSISNDSFGVGARAELVEGEADDNSQHRIKFLPAFDCSASLWYRGHYIRISRSELPDGPFYTKEILTMKILARDHKIVNQLLLDAKVAWKTAKEEFVSIYSSNTKNEWRLITSRPKRPLSSIVLDVGVKEKILDDAKDFLDNKRWYAERGIPFRRGYLLYGAPGSGKTSIIHSLAGELGLDVYIISLSRSGLDDNALQDLIADLPEKCIALMEDVDAAFHHSITRNPESPEKKLLAEGKATGPSSNDTSKISLSGLLNALDGVGAQEGRLLFATTNRYEALDAALRRPGRMDVHVEFKLASKHQAAELFKRFYMSDDTTTMKAEDVSDGGESDKDSGYSTPPKEKLVDVELPEGDNLLVSGQKGLGLAELALLNEKFKEHIPDREFSMAAIQGYLMMHKGRPHDAIECAEGWVKEEKTRKEKAVKDTV